jgi:hypothetical protein
MGWFSNVCSKVGTAVRNVASSVASVASDVWKKTKEVAAKAVVWMADNAETFVADVKEAWKKVKPYIEKLSPFLKQAAKAVGVKYPWLSGALLILDTTLQGLLALENSPVLKKLEAAINWTIAAAKNFKATFLTPEDIEEANKRKETFKEAAQNMSEADAHALALAAMINDYVKIQSVIKIVFESAPPADFDHYLRLRATQKLLASVEGSLNAAQSVGDISSDDLFMLDVAAELIRKSPQLSDENAIKLDEIILRKFNKKLIPFVFEEMISAWELDLQTNQEEWAFLNSSLAKETVLLRRLEVSKRISELTVDEEKLLSELLVSVPILKNTASVLEKKNREMQNYVYAAEGFLQVLEKSGDQLEAEGRGYLAEEGSKVGMIVIDCAQNGKAWELLNDEEQSLIIDFANIFEEDCQSRLKKMLEVEVGV